MHDAPMDAARRGYESSVFGIQRIAWFSLGLVVLMIATAIAAKWMIGGTRLPAAPVAQIPGSGQAKRPPAPVLQDAPASDLRGYRREKAAELETWGWVDRDAGIVRMPIGDAMTLLAGKAARGAESKAQDRQGKR